MMATSKCPEPVWHLLFIAFLQTISVLAQDISPTEATTTAAASTSSPPTTTTFQSSTSASSISRPQTHTIQVGLLDHKMRPETTEAAVGDLIEFDFYPLNHSIVRAEYGFPCIPYEMTGPGKTGFFSGFNPANEVSDDPPKFTIRINDTQPIFFYCSAPGSCITYGMVGGINLNSSMSIDKQRTLAMDSSFMLQPGQPFPAESPPPSGNPASSVVPSSSSTSTLVSAASHSSSGLDNGAIAGITVAAVLALLGAAVLFFYCGRNKSLREATERRSGTIRRTSTSPDQVLRYKQQNVHTHPAHAHAASFRFPPHPAVHPVSHPGSPDPGFGHANQPSMGCYLPSQGYDARKYTSPMTGHAAYHVFSPGSPPPGNMGLNGHPYVSQAIQVPRGGTPAPGYYDTFQPNGQQVQERAVEMEAITVVNQAEADARNRASKF